MPVRRDRGCRDALSSPTTKSCGCAQYLLKGGFLWSDDFWGAAAWDSWVAEIARDPAAGRVSDRRHPSRSRDLPHAVPGDEIPQIPSIQFWRTNGGATSERGAESDEVHFRGISDQHGRLMVLMTHNTDISDAWEREGEDPRFFYQFSPDGYAVGINVLLYSMTH